MGGDTTALLVCMGSVVVMVLYWCVLSSCFRPFRLEFLGQFGTVLGRLSVAGVLRVIS